MLVKRRAEGRSVDASRDGGDGPAAGGLEARCVSSVQSADNTLPGATVLVAVAWLGYAVLLCGLCRARQTLSLSDVLIEPQQLESQRLALPPKTVQKQSTPT